MLLLDRLRLEAWRPESVQSAGRLTWVRVWARDALGKRGLLLSNHLAGVRWEEQPLTLLACDRCAREECADIGYGRIARSATHLFLLPPARSRRCSDRISSAPAWLARRGAAALDLETWSELETEAARQGCAVPPETVFPPLGRADLWAAWVAGLPPLLRRAGPDLLPDLLARHLGPDQARSQAPLLALVQCACRWFRGLPPGPLDGGLLAVSDLGARVSTLAVDPERGHLWRPLAELPGGALVLCLGDERVLLGAPPIAPLAEAS